MIISASVQEALNKKDIIVQWLIWGSAKNRETSVAQPFAFWTGPEDIALSVDGTTRTFSGFGEIVEVPDLTFSEGLNVQQQRMILGVLSPEGEAVLRLHDFRGGPVKIHAAIFDKDTTEFIGTISTFDGWVNEVKIIYDEGNAYAEVALVSNAYEGTKVLLSKKSNASQKARGTSDRFREYGSVSDQVNIAWGMEDARIGRHTVTRPGVVNYVLRKFFDGGR